jgi:RHS repeat-associated protein
MKTLRILIVLTLLLSGCRITTVIQGKGLVASPNGTFFCSETGGNCTEQYTNPTTETLFAGPAPGYTFASWAGCSYVSLTSCATSISQGAIDANYQWTVTARFKPVNPPVQVAAYTYNALGQRITKTVGGVTTIFQHDMDGKLIAELNASGQPVRQHIHVNGEPIAQVSTNTANGTFAVQYVHTDHLGTPTLLTDQGKAIVADIEATPFGETYVDYATVVHNQRFPGQYKDEETGLHYNHHRDYDPTLGRYIQSDPIGLDGGLNTYIYVGGNPLMYADPYGLAWFRPEGHEYKAGRRDTIVPEGPQGRGRFIDDYVPAGHTFAAMHDKFVGEATTIGFPDWLVNWPFFGPIYARAVQQEILNSLFGIVGLDAYEHKIEDDCN